MRNLSVLVNEVSTNENQPEQWRSQNSVAFLKRSIHLKVKKGKNSKLNFRITTTKIKIAYEKNDDQKILHKRLRKQKQCTYGGRRYRKNNSEFIPGVAVSSCILYLKQKKNIYKIIRSIIAIQSQCPACNYNSLLKKCQEKKSVTVNKKRL